MDIRCNAVLEDIRHTLDRDAARFAEVRDRALIRQAVMEACEDDERDKKIRLPVSMPVLVLGLVEGLWDYDAKRDLQEASWGIAGAVKRLLELLRNAPGRAWEALKAALRLDDLEGMSAFQKAKAIGSRAAALGKQGKAALGKAIKKAATTFPLSMFFVSKKKMPGLTDLVARILKKSPRMQKLLSKIHAGAEVVDAWLKKYIPRTSKALYAAIFIYVWMNVAELSWDIDSILRGFLGQISLGDLLASLPESGLGLLAASFGLGYGALPYALIARLVWLVANQFLTYVPGKGLKVHWPKMGVEEPEETVPA
jgi:hypothetical protein